MRALSARMLRQTFSNGVKDTKIKTIKDIVEASNKIIGNIVSEKKLTRFCLTVDHEEGTISSCAWTPILATATRRGQFLAVEDYT